MKEVTIAYGMTETSPVSWQSRVDDPMELRCETVGRIMPHTECKITTEDGDIAKISEPGEIWTRGYLVMKGYFNNLEQTEEILQDDGWLRTGDVGSVDSTGFLRIGGRIKDVVIRGGENLFPKEIEDFLHALPMIREVEVVGVPDEKYGEELCAFVVPSAEVKETEESELGRKIKESLSGQISHFKIPKHIIFRQNFDDVKTVTGKTMKFRLRDMAKQELGLVVEKLKP